MTKEEGDEDEDGDEDKDKDLEICAAQTLDGWETGQGGQDRVWLPPFYFRMGIRIQQPRPRPVGHSVSRVPRSPWPFLISNDTNSKIRT